MASERKRSAGRTKIVVNLPPGFPVSKVNAKSEPALKIAKVMAKSKENIAHWNQFREEAAVDFRQNWMSKSPQTDMSVSDFNLIAVLSKGDFGNYVVLAESKFDLGYFALKIYSKEKLVVKNRIPLVLREKRIMENIRCPFVNRCYSFFQDNSFLYLSMMWLQGGDAYSRLSSKGKMTEPESMFLAAQTVLGLEYLHSLNLVHRDLKPEHILYDAKGFVKLTGFTLSKIVDTRTYTVCGTTEYMAPELIMGQGYGKSVDWWALGVTIYELNSGKPPFVYKDKMKMFAAICEGRFRDVPDFSRDLKNLLVHLVTADLTKRLGLLASGASDIKSHPWFNSINWGKLINKASTPPFEPKVESPLDLSYFPQSQTDLSLSISASNHFSQIFDDF